MPKIDRLAIYDRDGGICGFCGQAVSLDQFHVDHVLAVGLGGTDDPSNLRVAHARCNRADAARVRIERRRLNLDIEVGRGLLRIRLPGAVYNALDAIATREDRYLNAQMVRALREWLAAQKAIDD